MEIELAALDTHVGQEVVVGDWLEITQARIDQFANATDDFQWLHVDTARAATESPYKTTIAHGFLTLSLVSLLLRRALTISDLRMAINYGVNRVRFVSAVPSGSRIRGRFTLAALERLAGGGVQATWSATIERDGGDKPACVIEWLVRYYA
jgi:acyl dehydratase